MRSGAFASLEVKDRLVFRDRVFLDPDRTLYVDTAHVARLVADSIETTDLRVSPEVQERLSIPLSDETRVWVRAAQGDGNRAPSGSVHVAGTGNVASEDGCVTWGCVNCRLAKPDAAALHARGSDVDGEAGLVVGSGVTLQGDRSIVVRAGQGKDRWIVREPDQLVLGGDRGVSVQAVADHPSVPVPMGCVSFRFVPKTGDLVLVFASPDGTVRRYALPSL